VTEAEFVKEFHTTYKGTYPIIGIETYEEKWCLDTLRKYINEHKDDTKRRRHHTHIKIWSSVLGWDYEKSKDEKTRKIELALKQIYDEQVRETPTRNGEYATMYVLRDLNDQLKNNELVQRWLREIYAEMKASFNTLIIMQPIIEIPQNLEKEIVIMDFAVADTEKYRELWQTYRRSNAGSKSKVEFNNEQQEQFLRGLSGFTVYETEHIFPEISAKFGQLFDSRAIAFLRDKKKQHIRKSGILEYIDDGASMEEIGGLEVIKEYVSEVAESQSEEAREFGIENSKGFLALGPPGVGKTLIAKAVAGELQWPLIRFDIGSLFGNLVGSSESKTRRALKLLSQYAPAVVLMDELDKYISGLKGSTGDSGVGSRVLGYILQFMSDTKDPLFFVATSNSIHLPPEILRKGRWDELFYVGLPNKKQRRQIWRIHLRAVKKDPKDFDLKILAKATEGFSGAEIKAAIQAGLKRVWPERSELDDPTLLTVIKETFPLSTTMKEELKALDDFAEKRCRNASTETPAEEASKGKKKSMSINDVTDDIDEDEEVDDTDDTENDDIDQEEDDEE
jgi:SpoVK/Ycf46/Vps4 family AAA+-type ATPase